MKIIDLDEVEKKIRKIQADDKNPAVLSHISEDFYRKSVSNKDRPNINFSQYQEEDDPTAFENRVQNYIEKSGNILS